MFRQAKPIFPKGKSQELNCFAAFRATADSLIGTEIAITAATEAVGGKYLNDCALYVTVEPCPMCAGALAWSQIGKVVYGASDPKRGFSQFSPSLMHPKTEVLSGVLAEECAELVSEFFRSKRG